MSVWFRNREIIVIAALNSKIPYFTVSDIFSDECMHRTFDLFGVSIRTFLVSWRYSVSNLFKAITCSPGLLQGPILAVNCTVFDYSVVMVLSPAICSFNGFIWRVEYPIRRWNEWFKRRWNGKIIGEALPAFWLTIMRISAMSWYLKSLRVYIYLTASLSLPSPLEMCWLSSRVRMLPVEAWWRQECGGEM
jgi:hypothetical protein